MEVDLLQPGLIVWKNFPKTPCKPVDPGVACASRACMCSACDLWWSQAVVIVPWLYPEGEARGGEVLLVLLLP